MKAAKDLTRFMFYQQTILHCVHEKTITLDIER